MATGRNNRAIIIFLTLSMLVGPGALFAQGTEGKDADKTDKNSSDRLSDKGIMKEFRKLEEEIRGRRRGPAERKRILELNLTRAMAVAIGRRFYAEKKELLKGLKAESLTYDNPTSPVVYYVKYTSGTRTFIVRFDFARDPEYYLQSPENEKFLIRGDADHDKTGENK